MRTGSCSAASTGSYVAASESLPSSPRRTEVASTEVRVPSVPSCTSTAWSTCSGAACAGAAPTESRPPTSTTAKEARAARTAEERWGRSRRGCAGRIAAWRATDMRAPRETQGGLVQEQGADRLLLARTVRQTFV